MTDSGAGNTEAKAVHPFVEQARRIVLRGRAISLGAPSIEETEKRDPDWEPPPSAVSWLSVAEGVVEHSHVDIVFLDFTGHAGRSLKLASLAESAQRTFRSSLVEPFGIWKGDWLAFFRRFLSFSVQNELWWPEFDMGERYMALLKAIVLETCRPPIGPPRSNAQLRKRLEDKELPTRDALSAFRPELIDNAIHRMCRGLEMLGEAATKLNGRWTWKDTSIAYVGVVDEESMVRDTLGDMLIVSLAEHLEELYRRRRSCVVFFEAPPPDVRCLGMERLFGAACASSCGVVLLPGTEREPELARFYSNSFPSLNALEESLAEAA